MAAQGSNHPARLTRHRLLQSLWPEADDFVSSDPWGSGRGTRPEDQLASLINWSGLGVALVGDQDFVLDVCDLELQLDHLPDGTAPSTVASGSGADIQAVGTNGASIRIEVDSDAEFIRQGWRVPGRKDARYAPLQLCALALGGYFGSELTRVLRSEKGVSYAPRALLDPLWTESMFLVEIDAARGSSELCLEVVRSALERLSTEGRYPTDRLERARNFALGSLAMSTSSTAGLASILATTLTSNLPNTWLAEYPDQLLDVTAAQISQTVGALLVPDRRTLVLGHPKPDETQLEYP